MRVRTAPYVARAHASRPPQSRHISCAAKPLSALKLPPTACGTRAHQKGKTSPCTQAGLCYRTALLMCMGMFPLVGRACVGVCVGAGVLCDHSGATRQASTPLPRHPRKRRHLKAAYLLLTRAAPMRLHRRQTRRRVRTAPASRAHTSACLTALRSNLSCAAKPPNHETLPPTAAWKLPRWLRTCCSLAPHLCGFTAARHADVCAQLLRRARTHLRV